jgi:hypothetical protein
MLSNIHKRLSDPLFRVIKSTAKAAFSVRKYTIMPYLKNSGSLPIVQIPELSSQLKKRHYFNHIEYSP